MKHEFAFTKFRFLKIGSFLGQTKKLGFHTITFHYSGSGSSPRLLANRTSLRRNQADPRPGFAAIARLSAGFRGCAVARGCAQSRTAGCGREVARGVRISPDSGQGSLEEEESCEGGSFYVLGVGKFCFYREASSSQYRGK